jgi:hypothetical protein
MIKYVTNYECGSDLLMRWLSLFLACQHLSSGTSARIRAGSRSKRFLCFILIDVRCFRLPSKMSSRTPRENVPQVEDNCSRQSVHKWR